VLEVLSRHDIDLAPQQFTQLCDATGATQEEGAQWSAVLAYFRDVDED
jgi:predicted component of type VI protein secretion system